MSSPFNVLIGKITLSELSEIDRSTLYLRGGLGRFKPENPTEITICREALGNGATETLETWTIIDSVEGIEFRRQYNSVIGFDSDGNRT